MEVNVRHLKSLHSQMTYRIWKGSFLYISQTKTNSTVTEMSTWTNKNLGDSLSTHIPCVSVTTVRDRKIQIAAKKQSSYTIGYRFRFRKKNNVKNNYWGIRKVIKHKRFKHHSSSTGRGTICFLLSQASVCQQFFFLRYREFIGAFSLYKKLEGVFASIEFQN